METDAQLVMFPPMYQLQKPAMARKKQIDFWVRQISNYSKLKKTCELDLEKFLKHASKHFELQPELLRHTVLHLVW